MIQPGLVSVSFRSQPAEQVAALAARAGLGGIEWGGDVHVPHGDVARARQVRALTLDWGLALPSYGSYYRVGDRGADNPGFAAVLRSAAALQTPVIRVWAGRKGSLDADKDYRQAIVSDSRRIADMAAAQGMAVDFEFHGGTLTDRAASAVRLLERADRPNLLTYWQPPVGLRADRAARGLVRISPWLSHVHVFHWQPETHRRPLAQGATRWRRYLNILRAVPGDRYALLEFCRGDDPAQMMRDAQTLRAWLGDQ